MAIAPPNPDVLRAKIEDLRLGPKRPLSPNLAQRVIQIFLDETDRDAPFSAAAVADRSHFAGKPEEFTVATRMRFPVGKAEPLEQALKALDARAIFYESLSRLDMARFLRQRALALCEVVCAPIAPELVTALIKLGELEMRMGEFTSADAILSRAVELAQRNGPENSFEVASTLHERGRALATMGLYKGASRAIERAIELLRSIKPKNDHNATLLDENVAILEEDLAVVFLKAGRSDLAMPVIRRVVDRMKWAEMAQLPPARQGGIANYLMLLKRFKESEKLFGLALEQLGAQTGEWTATYASTLSNLGTVCRMQGEWEQAERAFARAAHIRRVVLGPDHPAVAQSLLRLALTEAARGNPSAAWAAIKEALQISDRLIGDLSSLASSSDRLSFLSEMRNQAMVAVSIVCEFFADHPDLASDAYGLVLHRKALSVEALAAERNALLSGRYPHLRDQMEKLDSLRTQLIEATVAQVREEDRADQQFTIKRLRAQRDDLSSQLAREIPEIRLEETLAAATSVAVEAALPTDCRLVEFFLLHPYNFSAVLANSDTEFHPNKYVAFVIDGERDPHVRLVEIGSEADIDGLISKFTSAITSEDSSSSEIGTELAKRLGPVLAGAPARLFIAADGNLSLLPFDTLPIEGTSSVLVDRHELTFVGSGRDLINFEHHVRCSDLTHAVIFAGPDFDANLDRQAATTAGSPQRRAWADELDRFESLPGAAAEGLAVAALVPGAVLFTGENATVRAFRALQRPELLHLATHAFVLNPQKGRTEFDIDAETDAMTASGLAMAGANSWGSDDSGSGIVMAEEIATTDLRNTSLVVLSACDTGRGLVMPGEGVFGLRRAFRIAGAQTVVMTLWTIPDEETTHFMTMFYERLRAGKPKASALRDAKLGFRKQYPAPYFWAGFVCEGDPAPLQPQAEGLRP